MHLLRNSFVVLLVSTALFAFGGAARAQQDGDMTVIIKTKSKANALPTLLVMCDMICNWKLDGEAKGRIDEGGSVKIKVEAGEHMVEADTEDGVDQVKQPTTVKPTGQTMVDVELWPIRYARLVANQEASDKAVRDAQAEAERESREKDVTKAREEAALKRAAREESERQPWADPATGLMWAKKDNGSDVSLQEAMDYCKNLQLAGHTDWRLPTVDELHGISDPNAYGVYLKGNLQLSGWAWTGLEVSGRKSKTTGQGWAIDPAAFGSGLYPVPLDGHGYSIRALCVRGAANS